MKILILGGTGVMGNYLVSHFNSMGYDVLVTSRKEHTEFGSIRFVQGNAMDISFVSEVCNQCNWDAIVDFMSYKTNEFLERVSLFLSSTKQYVFISTARVYGNLEHPIKETSPRLLDCSEDKEYLSTDEYALTKARQENALLNSGKTNFTIIRPCIIYGDNRLQLGVLEKEEWLYRAILKKKIVLCKEIQDKITTMTNGADIARAFIRIIGNPDCSGQIYHLTCNHHRTWNEIFDIYNKAFKEIMGRDLEYKVVSLDSFIDSRPDFKKYQVIYDRVFNHDFDVSKESTIIDVDSFVEPEMGLRLCLSNHLNSNKNFYLSDPVYEAKRDKLTGDFSSLSDFCSIKNKLKYLYYRIF